MKEVGEQKQKISVAGSERNLETQRRLVNGSLTRGLATWVDEKCGEDKYLHRPCRHLSSLLILEPLQCHSIWFLTSSEQCRFIAGNLVLVIFLGFGWRFVGFRVEMVPASPGELRWDLHRWWAPRHIACTRGGTAQIALGDVIPRMTFPCAGLYPFCLRW